MRHSTKKSTRSTHNFQCTTPHLTSVASTAPPCGYKHEARPTIRQVINIIENNARNEQIRVHAPDCIKNVDVVTSWLNGRASDSGSEGWGFESPRRYFSLGMSSAKRVSHSQKEATPRIELGTLGLQDQCNYHCATKPLSR